MLLSNNTVSLRYAGTKQRLSTLQKKLIDTVLTECPGSQLNGHPSQRLYNNISLSFSQVTPDDFPLGLSGLALSSGSACSSQAAGPSYVLKGIGLSDELASSAIRIGLGRFTTEEDVDTAIGKILKMHKKSA